MKIIFENFAATGRKVLLGAALGVGLLTTPMIARAQEAVVGSLTNFDAANFEGRDAFGFEIQIEGLQPSDLGMAWNGNKFGTPENVPYATGVYVRYKSPWDPVTQQFTAWTVPHAPNTPFAATCYPGGATYLLAGCDHFGPRPNYPAPNYTVVAYRWMFPDPANPGQLIASTTNIFVPNPVYTFVPAANPINPPVLVAEVQMPEPPDAQYGDATWMKVFKTEFPREVALEELTSDNPIVPQDATQIETNWKLMQPTPVGAHKQRGKHANQGSPNAGSRAVIRRYETYAYTGAYNPLTHEAVCGGDGSCNAPLDGELGDMLVAQMAAANIAVPSITISKVGSGNVSSADKLISCGSKCGAIYAFGTNVTLTAQPASNNTFTGWAGACTGAALTCNVTVNDELTALATFQANPAGGGGGGGGGGTATTQFTLSVGRSNPGTVTATPAGNDRVLDCGSACSAKFNSGTVVTLTAIPPAGKTFASWGGACSGTTTTCTVTITKDTSVQANFNK